ncbi:MAG: DUF72 domain-containing protein, partial [Anaerolineae bacterium]
ERRGQDIDISITIHVLVTLGALRVWVERTPDDFTFHIKLYSLFTLHGAGIKAMPKDIREALPEEAKKKPRIYWDKTPSHIREEMVQRYKDALQPLHEVGKLGYVLAQFGHWVYPNGRNRAHIEMLKEAMDPYIVAAEFRNLRWLDPDGIENTLEFLEEREIPFVSVDEPQGFKSSVPPVAAATSDNIAVIRFHGRNSEKWEAKGLKSSAERFDYWYAAEEMEEWKPRIEVMQGRAAQVFAMMNTNNSNQGPANALLLQQVMGLIPEAG